jgi:hypothetical protein
MSSLLWDCMHKHGVLKKLKVAMPPVKGNLVIAEEMLEGRMEWGVRRAQEDACQS